MPMLDVPVAIPQGKRLEDIEISSVGICAGSGGSLLHDLDVDLLFTGELSHHEALAVTEAGRAVIAPFHSNTERGFMHHTARHLLLDSLQKAWIARGAATPAASDMERAVWADNEVEVDVSREDRDPYQLVSF
ncbi:MAG: hypothetical protein M1833_005034 [Piccolia ochrophora]|nr:MAG: hypothetical protein M1833_005034 [Piccolia ochrophora]